MRLVIDKDFDQIQTFNESWAKSRPTYKVKAVSAEDKFVYAKDLKTITEAKNAVLDLAWDSVFEDCVAEIDVVSEGKEMPVWSSDGKVVVTEGAFGDFFKSLGDGMKKALNSLGKAFKNVKDGIAKMGNEALNALRGASYITKDNKMTGVGYKAMTGQMKVADADKKNLENYWNVLTTGVKNVLDATKQYQPIDVKKVKGIIMNSDKDPINLTADVVAVEDNQPQTLMLTQDGDAKPEPKEGGNGENAGGEEQAGNANTKPITPDQAQKNPKAALGNLATRVANLEKQVGIAESSTQWNYNNEQLTNKAGIERCAIKRFFNEMNNPDVTEIRFKDIDGNTRTYYTNAGSSAYSQFKKDFKESTSSIGSDKAGEYKVMVESGQKSTLRGYKFSDFGMSDDFDSTSKVITISSTFTESSPDPDKKVVKEET